MQEEDGGWDDVDVFNIHKQESKQLGKTEAVLVETSCWFTLFHIESTRGHVLSCIR